MLSSTNAVILDVNSTLVAVNTSMNVTGTLKLATQTEMTYTTMIASTSSQIGYIISSKSFVTTSLTTVLSGYIYVHSNYH